ncbi:hypothetical protein RI054_20g89580 [Pseudoscourfieldia marina]
MRQDAMGCRGLPTRRSSHDGLNSLRTSSQRCVKRAISSRDTQTKVPPSFISLDFSYHPYGINWRTCSARLKRTPGGWDGLIVGYDTNTQVYEIAFSNGEFDDAKKNEFDVKGSALMTARLEHESILTSENRKNIFVPTNSRELMAMKPGPLKSRTLRLWAPRSLTWNGTAYTGVYLPRTTYDRGRVIFEIKFDPINGLLLKAKARLVAQGFTQIFGVDFFETYASTPKVSTMRMFMFIVVTYEMKMDEFDVRALPS